MSATVPFLTDEKGKQTVVVLPLADYEKLREDLSIPLYADGIARTCIGFDPGWGTH